VKQVFKEILQGEKRDPPKHPSRLLKRRRREVKEDPMLGGQRRIPCLVVNEDPLLGGQ